MKCHSTSSVFLLISRSLVMLSVRWSFIEFSVAVVFAPNKDDDSFATILMFLSSTVFLKMLGYELMNEIMRLVRLIAAGSLFFLILFVPPTRGYLRMIWCFLLLFIFFFLKWLEFYRDVCFPTSNQGALKLMVFPCSIVGFWVSTEPDLWGLRQGVPCQGVLMPLSFASQAGGSLTKNLG